MSELAGRQKTAMRRLYCAKERFRTRQNQRIAPLIEKLWRMNHAFKVELIVPQNRRRLKSDDTAGGKQASYSRCDNQEKTDAGHGDRITGADPEY